MTTTYYDLIRDHDRIDFLAKEVLTATRGVHPDFKDIRYQLDKLSLAISEHIAIEDELIAKMKIVNPQLMIEDRDSGGFDAFTKLKRDWMYFLHEWNTEAIEADFGHFRQRAEDVLLRIAEHVRKENQVLYSSALHASVITLR